MIRCPKPGERLPLDLPPIPGKPKPKGGGFFETIKDLIDLFKK